MPERAKDRRTYHCPKCDETVEMDPGVAPDEPACPACWSGWDDDFPVMVYE